VGVCVSGDTDVPGNDGAAGTGGGGTPGQGGNGIGDFFGLSSGAGGGGYFPGGSGGTGGFEAQRAGAASGGGGGGSSYTGGPGVSDATVTDTGNSGQINSGNGEIVLTYVNPLTAQAPDYTAMGGQQLNVAAMSGLLSPAAVLAPPGGSLTAVGPPGGTTAKGGTVTVDPDGSFSYSPPPGALFTDSFGYTVTDASGDYVTGTATVDVQAIPQAITFTTAPPSPALVGGSYSPAATGGGSGNPVVFSVDPFSAGVCSLSGEMVMTLLNLKEPLAADAADAAAVAIGHLLATRRS